MHLPDPDRLAAIYTACGLLALWVGWIKLARPKLRRARNRVSGAIDALMGREAISDPVSGKELAPALPGIGQRMATVEDTLAKLTEVVSEQAKLNGRVDRIEDQVGRNTENLAVIMAATAERIVTKAEAAEMWRAIADKDVVDGATEPSGEL